MPASSRLHYLDNLRALAMLAGVVFHAVLAYSPLVHTSWPAADVGGSEWVDFVAWFSHFFRMPVFFLVSGIFAAMTVEKRGLGAMLRHRMRRVLGPLLVFGPIVYVALTVLTARAASTVEHLSPALAWVKQTRLTQDSMPLLPTLAHLWFLMYLVCFLVLVWVLATLDFKRIASVASRAGPAVVAIFMPALLAPALHSVPAPWPAPDFVLPQLWAVAFFGAFFALGYLVVYGSSFTQRLGRWVPYLLASSLAAYVVYLVVPGSPQRGVSNPGWVSLIEACIGVWMTLCCLGAAHRWLSTPSRVMRYLADASYWVYLVHLPVLFAIQFTLLDIPAAWPLKFLLALSLTTCVCLGTYDFGVRRTFIGRFLTGSRTPRLQPAPQSGM